MTTEEDTKKSLTGKLGGQVNAFNRRLEVFEKQISQAKTIKSKQTLSLMNEAWTRCMQALNNIDETTEELDKLDPDGVTRRDTNFKGYQKKFDDKAKAASDVEKALVAPAPAPVAQTQAPAQLPGAPRSNDLLRPDPLNVDDRPTTVSQWKRVFTAYYKQHRMQLMSSEEQHLYFSQCLSRKLWTRISGYVKEDMPVLAKKAENPDGEEPDSCFKVLDTEF